MLSAAVGLAALTGAASAQDLQSFDAIERGRYLAVLGDCAACHTVPGGQPFAGGLALQTPFGKLVAPNITPDRETGIGNWTDDEFVAAMHDGRGRGGTRLYPAMPYPAYTKMTRDDVLDIRAYLATVAPVSNDVDREPAAVSVQHPVGAAVLELAKLYSGPLSAEPAKIIGMESRRLHRRRRRALRYVSHAEDPSRRR